MAKGQFVAAAASLFTPQLAGAITATVGVAAGGFTLMAAERGRKLRAAQAATEPPANPPAEPPAIPNPVNPDPVNPPVDWPPPVKPGPDVDPNTVAIRDVPTPCFRYRIHQGDNFFTVIGKAYGIKQDKDNYAVALMVNAHPFNKQFHVPAPANERDLWPTRISFLPKFGPSKHNFAAFFLPCPEDVGLDIPEQADPPIIPGDENANGDGQDLPACPMWSVTDLDKFAFRGQVTDAIDNLRGDPNYDTFRKGAGLPTAAEMNYSGRYYVDLALWLVARGDPAKLSVKPCRVTDPSQAAWREEIKKYYYNAVGTWP